RQATSGLYHAATAALMTFEASRLEEIEGDAKRALWAKLVADHHLAPRDPLAADDLAFEQVAAEMLLSPEPVAMSQVAPLLT
ncbi:MAG: hypothetical protein KDI19_09690, partial [Pseudomonadales bacterium]|nr:hypothetical protein [Pseudomonadales bacterium]